MLIEWGTSTGVKKSGTRTGVSRSQKSGTGTGVSRTRSQEPALISVEVKSRY